MVRNLRMQAPHNQHRVVVDDRDDEIEIDRIVVDEIETEVDKMMEITMEVEHDRDEIEMEINDELHLTYQHRNQRVGVVIGISICLRTNPLQSPETVWVLFQRKSLKRDMAKVEVQDEISFSYYR